MDSLVSTVVESVEDAKAAYLTADHLGSPRINTDRDGKVTARHDYHPYGEEIITAQRTSHVQYTPDSVRKQFTGYERDGETALDFAQARIYSGDLGRYTTTDPIVMHPRRATDPQQINLYIYTRNNPVIFIDRNGEKIEDSHLSDNKSYQKWKDRCLDTTACRNQWNKYAEMRNFTVTMQVVDRGTANMGAEVKNFVFDKDKNFVAATMELGLDLEDTGRVNAMDYPVTGLFLGEQGASGRQRAVAKIGHEFGHLDDFISLGTAFFEQESVRKPYADRLKALENKGLPYDRIFSDSELTKLAKAVSDRTGHSPNDLGRIRENRAEANNIPIIRQLARETRTLKAATRLSKDIPKY